MSYRVNTLIVGAMLGHSNLGFGIPDDASVENAVRAAYSPIAKRFPPDIGTMIEIFAQDKIETDEHYDYFRDEMQSWVDRLNDAVDASAEVQNHHNNAWAAFQRAMNNVGAGL